MHPLDALMTGKECLRPIQIRQRDRSAGRARHDDEAGSGNDDADRLPRERHPAPTPQHDHVGEGHRRGETERPIGLEDDRQRPPRLSRQTASRARKHICRVRMGARFDR